MYITQCPNCQTRFKVQPGQLDVCDGQVRCGRCATVFDARASLEPAGEPAPAKAAGATPPPPVAALAEDDLPAEAGHLVRALANAPQNGQWGSPTPLDEATAIPLPPDGELDRISKNIDLELPDFAAPAAASKPARQEPALRPDPLPRPAAPVAAKPAGPAAAPVATPAKPKQPEVIPDDDDGADAFLKKLQVARQQQQPAPVENRPEPAPSSGKRVEPSFKTEVLPDDDDDDSVVYQGRPQAADPKVEPAPFIAHSDELLKPSSAPAEKRSLKLPSFTLPKLPAFSLPRLPEFKFSGGGKLVWLWTAASVVAGLALLVQVVYVYRTPIAAELPGSRGVLESLCQGFGCDVPLPRRSEQLRTEYSELAAVPDQPNLIRVSATVRNQAPYPQQYPHLELTLKDGEERVLSRKVFAPKDYLSKNDFALGQFNGNSEIKVNMQLDIGLLRANGYSLMWFYP